MLTSSPASDPRGMAIASGLLTHLLDGFAPLIGLAGDLHRGIAERAHTPVIGLLETALAAEALGNPRLAALAPDLPGALMACLAAMGPAASLPRALGPLSLTVQRDDPADFDIRSPTHRFWGNLREGMLRQDMRGATGPGLLHSGNMVEFRLWGRAHCLDVENAIAEARIEAFPGRVALSQVSLISAPGRFGGAPRPVGRLTYTYEIRADSAWLGLAVRFDVAPGIQPQALRLITACDALSEALPYGDLAVDDGPVAPQPGTVTLRSGALARITTNQQGRGGRWLTLCPAAPEGVVNAKLSSREDGVPHWLLLRHAAAPGQVLREERLLLDRAGTEASQRGRDLGRPRGRGIALLAAAQYLRRPGSRGAAVAHFVAELRATLHAEPWPEALDAGFLILADLALDEPPDLAPLLAIEQRSGLGAGLEQGLYGDAADQAAAILALAALGLAEPLARALAPLGLTSAPVEAEGRSILAEFPTLGDGAPIRDGLGLGLLLRGLAGVARGQARGTLALDPLVAARAGRLQVQYAALLEARLRPRGEGLALPEPGLGAEVSGAGQAAALGYFAAAAST